MRRTVSTLVVATLVLILGATAALGHAAFREREVPADSEQTLVLRVPEERPGETTVAVETLVPAAFEILECPAEGDWTCEVEEAEEGTVLSWSRSSGTGDAMLSVRVRVPATPGDHRWPTIQTYDSGTEVAWAQRAGEDRPAPVLTVTDAGAPVVEDTSDPADHAPDEGGDDGDVAGDPVAEDQTVVATEPAETEFTPPVSPEATPADLDATVSPAPEEDGGGLSWITVVVIVAILAAAVGALRLSRRGPAG